MADRTALELLGPSTGGIRQHVAELCRRLPASGWQGRVAGPAGVADGLEVGAVSTVPVPSAPHPMQVLRATRAVRTLATDVDLIHAHGLKAGWIAVLARTGLPVVVTVHNLVLDEAAGRSAAVLRRLEGWLPGRVDAVIAVSEGIATRFGGSSARVRVIPPAGPVPHPVRSATAVRDELGVPAGAPLVVSVARLHPQKDLATLIAAAERLRVLVPTIRVVVVGEGPLEEPLRSMIRVRGLDDTVLLVGPTDNPADLMAAADAVVITSLWESGPLVASEAMLLDRPLVSTPVGFVPTLIEDGRSGRLVTIGDHEAVAAAVHDVLRDPVGARAMAEEGHRRAHALLGAPRLVAEVAAVYDEVLELAGRSGGSR